MIALPSISRRSLKRFIQYAMIGGSTFAFDLFLIYVLTDYAGVHYVLAAGIGFVIAVSINYFVSRWLVFKGTKRSLKGGYANFLLIAGTGLLFVTGSMFVLVEYAGAEPLVSRILIAFVTGMWNYLMNLYVNFKVAGTFETKVQAPE